MKRAVKLRFYFTTGVICTWVYARDTFSWRWLALFLIGTYIKTQRYFFWPRLETMPFVCCVVHFSIAIHLSLPLVVAVRKL